MTQSEKRKTVAVLFKAEKVEQDNDPYVEVLKDLGVTVSVIPILTFEFVNQDILQHSLKRVKDYSGVIFTSARAVEAVKKAFDGLKCDELIIEWNKKKNYCVGEATTHLAKTILNLDTCGGDITGSSEKLCDLIVSNNKMIEMPFIFPCSNVRKETIPFILSKNNIEVCEIISYRTLCNPSLKELWENEVSQKGVPEVLCFFSPSGVKYSHKLIQQTYTGIKQPKYIAIGPSTAEALHELRLQPCTYTKKPNPSAFYDAMKLLLKQ